MFDRIVGPLITELPPELIQHIFNFLPATHLGQVAQVNKCFKENVQDVAIRRAREYGYEGQDITEAQYYLHTLIREIPMLVKKGFIPKEYIVYTERWQFQPTIDCEMTLRNLTRAQGEEKARLIVKFNHALLDYAEKGRKRVCQALLSLGADVNAANGDGRTALHYTDEQGNKEACELLLDKGADVNAADRNGSTALHKAAAWGESGLIRVLLDAGADKTIVNHLGQQV